MNNRLRVGIIGLGRRWQTRYQPALAALPELFEISAVYDQIAQRTATEAARLRCLPAAGVSELVQREDVDAVLLLDLGWPRLWPIEQAARANKPVFCLPDLVDDDAHADALASAVAVARLPVMMAVTPALTPAALRLVERRDKWLGPIRLGICELSRGLEDMPSSGLLAWLLSLMGAAPEAVTVAGNAAAGLETMILDLAGGRALQLTTWGPSNQRSGLRLHLIGERGEATLRTPRQLRWRAADGAHRWLLSRGRRPEERLLIRFHAVVGDGAEPWPSLGDAYQALLCCRAAARSRTEGRRVTLAVAESSDLAGS